MNEFIGYAIIAALVLYIMSVVVLASFVGVKLSQLRKRVAHKFGDNINNNYRIINSVGCSINRFNDKKKEDR